MKDERASSRKCEKPAGQYANYFKVGHNECEFVIDLGQFYPENGEGHFHTRIITSPVYAKALLETLMKSIERHEQTFGAIQER